MKNQKERTGKRPFTSGRSGSKPPRKETFRRESPQSSGIIFGVLPVTEALRARSRRIEKILVAEGGGEKRIADAIEIARDAGIHFQTVPREQLNRIAGPGANHQGIIAQVSAADYADSEEVLERVAQEENPLVLVLDGVEDPRNLGAILRVAECAGVKALFLPEHRAVGLTETVVKTSAGATEYVETAKVKNLNRLIEQLKEMNIWVVGASGDAETEYSDWDWSRPTAVVMGSEGNGLHRLVAENCDTLVRIPMRGKINSLNVSVATGILLFEVVRQRTTKK